jgi:hypothetical protein
MSPSRASARTISENMRTLVLSLGATSSSIACMIEGTPAITITLPIQKPGAPDTLLRTRSAPLVELPRPPRFKPGDRVRVLHGPLAGHVGLYAGMKPRERIEVLLAILGGAQRVTLAVDAIEPAR